MFFFGGIHGVQGDDVQFFFLETFGPVGSQ